MRRRVTLVKTVFFVLLLASFGLIQYLWIKAVYHNKAEAYRSQFVAAIEDVSRTITFDSLFVNPHPDSVLYRAFASKGLPATQLEFSLANGEQKKISAGFTNALPYHKDHLTLAYLFPTRINDYTPHDLTVIIYNWKKAVVKDMAVLVTLSMLLFLALVGIFYYAAIWEEQRREQFYKKQNDLINQMMQQLETPLSTVSVATSALQNNGTAPNASDTNYYKEVIKEESKRMKEQVEQLLRKLE